MSLQKKFLGIEAWRYLLGVLSVSCISLAYYGSNFEKENRLNKERVIEIKREEREVLELYQINSKFNASIEDLGKVIRSHREKETLTNYKNLGRLEDVVVEERDTNSDGLTDLVTYYSEEQKARWPVVALNKDSKEYGGLIRRFSEGITKISKR